MSERFSYEKYYGKLPGFEGRDWTEPQAKLDAYLDLREKYLADYERWYAEVWGPAKKRGENPPSPHLDEWVATYST